MMGLHPTTGPHRRDGTLLNGAPTECESGRRAQHDGHRRARGREALARERHVAPRARVAAAAVGDALELDRRDAARPARGRRVERGAQRDLRGRRGPRASRNRDASGKVGSDEEAAGSGS